MISFTSCGRCRLTVHSCVRFVGIVTDFATPATVAGLFSTRPQPRLRGDDESRSAANLRAALTPLQRPAVCLSRIVAATFASMIGEWILSGSVDSRSGRTVPWSLPLRSSSCLGRGSAVSACIAASWHSRRARACEQAAKSAFTVSSSVRVKRSLFRRGWVHRRSFFRGGRDISKNQCKTAPHAVQDEPTRQKL